MEFPSFNHHHNRYVPPPPHPKNFSEDNPNLYPHRHHLLPPHRLPPPPLSYTSLPPPPPPPPILVPPPPPSYNPHQSNFTFLDSPSPSFHNHSRSSPTQPRFSNQSHRFDSLTDSWSDPHRIPSELPHRNPNLPDDLHRRLYPQSESYYKPNGSERIIPYGRYRNDTIIDGYASRDITNIVSQDSQVYRGSPNNNDHLGRIIDCYRPVTDINEATGSSARKLEDFVEKYEPRYMNTLENGRIWDHRGQDHSMKGKRNEFGHGGNDGVPFGNSREQSWNYDYELSKFNRVRECREEFKQVQKKSVLLRIGKPNNTYRNRNHEHFSKAYLVESNNSNFRGKDKDKDHVGKDSGSYLDQRMEGDRERSPVELDVSFKSNQLVAKAVVTPSSPVFDNSCTQPRNKKIKRVTEFNSPSKKSSEISTRPGSSSNGLECSSSLEKASTQLKDKDSVYDGAGGSLSGSVLDKGRDSGGSDRPLSFRLRKKRKFVNLGLHASNFQLAKKDDKSVKGENTEDIPNAPIIPFPPLEELIASKVDESPEAMVPEKDGSEVENPSFHDINSFGDEPTEIRTITAQEVSMKYDGLVNDLSPQFSQIEVPVNLENDTQMVYTDVKVSLGGTEISASSGHDQTEIQKCLTESFAGVDAVNISNSLCNVSLSMQETSIPADMNPLYPCSEEITTVSPENDDVQGFLNDVPRKEKETELLECTTNTDTTHKFPEESPTESTDDVVIAEDDVIHSSDKSYLPVVKRKKTDSVFMFNSTTLAEIHENVVDTGAAPSNSLMEISSDKDEVTEDLRSDLREPITDEICLPPNDSLPPSSSIFSLCADGTSVFVTNSNDQSGESMPDMLTIGVPSQNVSSCSEKSTEQTISNSSTPMNDALLNGPESSIITIHPDVTGLMANTKTTSSASQGSVKTQVSNLPMKKPSSASAVQKPFTGRSSPVFINSRINNPANNITKPRTWHRSTSNPAASVTKSSSVSVPPLPKPIDAGQNSYIRSGNTLVRKGAPVTAISGVLPASRSSVYQLNPSGPIETRSGAGSGSKSHSIYSKTGGSSALVVRPKTPPLPGSTKLPDCTTMSSRDLPSSPLEHLSLKGNSEEGVSPVEGSFAGQIVSEYYKLPGAPEDQNGTSNNYESQKTLDEGTTGKKILYVKRKSNQLVAASSSDQSVQDLDKTQPSSSDGYYKRSKNQLIRGSVGEDAIKTDMRKASKTTIKRQFGKGVYMKYRHLRFSSVWTPSSQSSGKDSVSLCVKPHLFPWRRSRYGGNLMNVSASTPSNNSSSSISRKLLLSRKREMVYTRSRHGFSLRMSKLLSVGGSSLKWSKSLERNSKIANEEATLAVAAAEKKKREQHEIKSRDNMSRDRIFRIGLVRYKMDPSRRTLQRISDEETSTSVQSKEEIKRSYVPKRLLIGHNEYVRIGNGNQLVRNPKRRTRIFANEKVRWSLHTARSRLAKKKKYCQFFTRFGKCNKDDGKCPYIHDSSKIAVCTKFLNGSCSNPNCKLTHKVIPERMQDCLYFSQGLCSNEHCPYRHVNVNSVASVCEGFLKGYCADGNECRKKHTYACPEYEATGTCPRGTKCKLHHPKNRNMGLKRKQQNSMENLQKNSRGRYFGSVMCQEAMPVSNNHHLKDNNGDILCQEGKFAEYISLGFSNEEAGDATNDQQRMATSEPMDLGEADFDELTKPVGLMNKVVVG